MGDLEAKASPDTTALVEPTAVGGQLTTQGEPPLRGLHCERIHAPG